ncbi:MAG TPA: serine hydrolase [Thermoanaerobaculia bacterium]|nr:serine hydrolase [Thermoanaerobaculia bacterium]
MRALGALLALACLAAAPVLAIEDRDNSNVTGWAWYYGKTEAQVTAFVNGGLRIVDLKVENPAGNPKTFTVAFVSNTGTFARNWNWLYDATPTDAYNFAINNNNRPVVVDAYEIAPGDVRVAMVYVVNTGADAKTWWFYPGLLGSSIGTTAAGNNARLTQISRYATGGQTYFAVIMIANTGADAKTWWYYYGHTTAEIDGYVAANNARLTDLDYHSGSGTYSAIMESCASGCPEWWYWWGLTEQGVNDMTAQETSRVIDVQKCGVGCFTVILLLDANAITARVGDLLRSGTEGTGATTGLYLKRVGGPVLASMEAGYVYEPASAIKIGPATLAITRVQAGTANLTDLISHNTDGANSCPSPSHFSGTESLQTGLQQMMRHSDNARTLEVITWEGGNSVVNNFMHNTVGMADTTINQILGCASPPDTYTLYDAGLIYEGVADGTLLDATHKAMLFSVMAGKAEYAAEGYDFIGIWTTDFDHFLAQEAPAQMSAANKAWWKTEANEAAKAGGYTLCQNGPCNDVVEDIDVTGWASLPFCSGLTVTPHEFVFGMFISNAEDTSWFNGKTTAADTTFGVTKAEVLREQVRASLLSCLHGDANHDGVLAVADVFYLINYLFAGGPPPLGYPDVTGDAKVDVNDVFYLINYLFAGGPAPL